MYSSVNDFKVEMKGHLLAWGSINAQNAGMNLAAGGSQDSKRVCVCFKDVRMEDCNSVRKVCSRCVCVVYFHSWTQCIL